MAPERSKAPERLNAERSHDHLGQATHVSSRSRASIRWAHLDSNQDLTGYEPGALPLSYGPAGSVSRFEKAPQFLRARWVAELAERLGLDLADALARDREILTDLLQRMLAAVGQTEAEAQHLLLAGGEGVQYLVRL